MDRFDKGTGIVCEYNPFHKGHAYQIKTLKSMGAKFIVCAMSGDFVQRGELSYQDKRVRAKNAVENGADIVLEIPFPFSSLGAEGFASAGVSILENSGLCSSFGFGSECADVAKLSEIAHILDEDFRRDAISMQKDEPNLSYAAARQRLLSQRLSKEYADIITNPNDILGVEYIKANKNLFPIAIKRETPRGGYDDAFASSSYIRQNLFDEQNKNTALERLPDNYCFDGIYENTSLFYNHILVSLMQKTPEELSDIAEINSGSEYSIIKNSVKAQSFEELCRLLSSKTHTDAKVRRMLLFAFFGVTKQMANQSPLYTEVLATSDLGKKMLKKYRGDRKMIVASRVAEIKKSDKAFLQYSFSRRCAEVLDKCIKLLP
ncbi:MAG: nucleotidyltransferase family protein [Clostridia bacterium]|nr:nucleotidyltransferase family protein [Clostridia bacterium]